MNPNAEFERNLEEWLQTEAPAGAPTGFHASVMDRARTLRQRPGWATSLPVRRFGRGRGMTLLAAAALLLVGGALAAGSGLMRLPTVVPPAPAPSVVAVTTVSPDPTTTPTPRPSAFVTPSPTPLSLDLTFTELPIVESSFPGFKEVSTRLAWLGDRFVLVDVTSGAVMTSTDGQEWQALQGDEAAQSYVDLLRGAFESWQDSVVGWWNPQDRDGPDIAGAPPITARDNVQVVIPPAAPTTTTPFKGRIESLGIGPRGIVAQVHSDLDWDDWVRRKLGARTNNEWVTHVENVVFRNGVLRIRMDNGPGLRVVWADEGLEPGDYQDRGFGWFSPDGVQWTAMAPNDQPTSDSGSSLPTGGFGSVVGVSDGFLATGAYPDGTCADPNGSCTGMWFSSDGLTWRLLGTAPEIGLSGRELCIRDTCSGTAGELLPWKGGALAIDGDGRVAFWTSGGPTELPIAAHVDGKVATGPLGIVSIGDGQVLVSRDGIDSKVSSLPAQMDEPRKARIAVGERTVLVLESGSLWLGTFEP